MRKRFNSRLRATVPVFPKASERAQEIAFGVVEVERGCALHASTASSLVGFHDKSRRRHAGHLEAGRVPGPEPGRRLPSDRPRSKTNGSSSKSLRIGTTPISGPGRRPDQKITSLAGGSRGRCDSSREPTAFPMRPRHKRAHRGNGHTTVKKRRILRSRNYDILLLQNSGGYQKGHHAIT